MFIFWHFKAKEESGGWVQTRWGRVERGPNWHPGGQMRTEGGSCLLPEPKSIPWLPCFLPASWARQLGLTLLHPLPQSWGAPNCRGGNFLFLASCWVRTSGIYHGSHMASCVDDPTARVVVVFVTAPCGEGSWNQGHGQNPPSFDVFPLIRSVWWGLFPVESHVGHHKLVAHEANLTLQRWECQGIKVSGIKVARDGTADKKTSSTLICRFKKKKGNRVKFFFIS